MHSLRQYYPGQVPRVDEVSPVLSALAPLAERLEPSPVFNGGLNGPVKTEHDPSPFHGPKDGELGAALESAYRSVAGIK